MDKAKLENICTYVLFNEELHLEVMNLGATVIRLRFLGRELTLSSEKPELYLERTAFLGAVVGRYANCIHKAQAQINGQTYQLFPNEGDNQLHGGPEGFHGKLWTADVVTPECVHFYLQSPDGENGYPGNLTAGVTYRISGNKLQLEFDGMSDQDTLYTPTTHMYFNFGGASILDAKLQLNASSYLAVDKENIPVAILPVDDTFDFRTLRSIGHDYDHCFPIVGDPACILEDQDIRMTIRTNYPSIQVYTGTFLDNPLYPNQGIALEPEYYPDSPNHPDYPTAVLPKDVQFRWYIEYRFEECCKTVKNGT